MREREEGEGRGRGWEWSRCLTVLFESLGRRTDFPFWPCYVYLYFPGCVAHLLPTVHVLDIKACGLGPRCEKVLYSVAVHGLVFLWRLSVRSAMSSVFLGFPVLEDDDVAAVWPAAFGDEVVAAGCVMVLDDAAVGAADPVA